MPIISKSENKTLTTKLIIMLTIDASGRVTDAILSKHNLTKKDEEKLRMKILTMSGWTAGSLNSQKVCCKHGWVISCIKWG
jgi:ABC-type oligopeptide transport system ATPase subunit